MLTVEPRLDDILLLYNRGQMLAAYEAAQYMGPLNTWRGPAARTLAGRLAMNLGAPRLGRLLHSLAYRETPHDPEAVYFHARALFEHRGPIPAWEFLQKTGNLDGAPADIRADWLAFYGHVAGMLRDFGTAEHWLSAAERCAPDRPWVCLERAKLLERQDRLSDALAVACHALELQAWYRPAVQAAAHLLELLDRDQAALEMLREAADIMQCGSVVMQLAALETELGLYDEARRSWDRFTELSPLLEPDFERWLAARKSDAAYYCGDWATAADLASHAHNFFHQEVAGKLRQTRGRGRRVVLPVGFVRQHHLTCAPATLAALSRFWSVPAHHLEVADLICYDGTAAHSERAWAEQNGFIAREFTVTWESAVTLLDRGVPFTFTTVEAGRAHLQAVIGYDSLRGTLLIRDPAQRHWAEFIAQATFDRHRSTGPRGMVLAPVDRPEILAGIELPDAAIYDAMHEVERALAAHDRQRAQAAFQTMQHDAPAHRLTLRAQGSLANYDADPAGELAAVEQLLAQYPNDASLDLSRLACLRLLARRDPRVALLRCICEKKGSDPVFWQQLAFELKDDAREHPQVIALLRRSLRHRRLDAGALRVLGDVLWYQRRLREALRFYRFAACLDDKDESLARAYFVASRHLQETDAAVRMLHDRCRRFGRMSSLPARSLFWAYEQLNQSEQGFEILDDALLMRPEDGDLILFTAAANARNGRFPEARELLEDAKGRASQNGWLRVSADIAGLQGDAPQALAIWRQIADAEPLDADAHHKLAQLIAETQSPAEARKYLRAIAERFPHNYRLTQLWVQWLKDDGPEAAEPAIRRLIEIHPADGWARRELAWSLCMVGELDEALAEAETALGLEPTHPRSHYTKGLVLARMGKGAEAKDAYRAAIALSVDADYAITELVNICDTVAQKQAALSFVWQELLRQTIFGEALLAYRTQARDLLAADELLESLRQALSARPDLWHAWSAVTLQLAQMNRGEEAEENALRGAERFPLLPKMWLDLAVARGVRQDSAGQIAALQKALELSPGFGQAVRQLAQVYERRGELANCRQLLEQAIQRAPLEAYNHGCLAEVLWKMGEGEAALARVERAVKLSPDYQWAWDMLVQWSTELKKPDLAADTARELTVRRAGEARSWLILARTLRGPATLEERLAALERASELSPRDIEAYDLRAKLLAQAGRFEDAQLACLASNWGDDVPTRLTARAAWIEAERGNYPAAISQMQRVVAEDPNYYWAWTCLADWRRATRAHGEYLEVAQTLVSRFPLDAVSQGYLGEALLLTGNRPAAKEILKKLVEQSPEYEFGAELLFDLAMKEDDMAAAATAITALRRHTPGPRTSTRQGRYAARKNDAGWACACLRDLSFTERANPEWITDVVAAMEQAGMSDRAEEVLRGVLTFDHVQPGAAFALVKLLAGKGLWQDARITAESLLARKPLGDAAAMALLHQFGQARQVREVFQFLATARQALNDEADLWGLTGYALQRARAYGAVVSWMADWENRPVQAWMLLHLAEAFRAVGRDADAIAVHQHAMSFESSEARSIHALWLASDAALAGQVAAAEKLLAQSDSKPASTSCRFIQTLIDALLAAKAGQPPSQVIDLVKNAETIHPEFIKDVELRRLRHNCLRRWVKFGPGVQLRGWAARESMRKIE